MMGRLNACEGCGTVVSITVGGIDYPVKLYKDGHYYHPPCRARRR